LPWRVGHALKRSKTHGLGLDNIKKRLELLYKDNYTLSINDRKTVYEIKLIIKTKVDGN
jgi:sensor histidine kinase YesM